MSEKMLEINNFYGQCYTTIQNRKLVARQILQHSHFMFFDADLIKYLDQFQEADAAVHNIWPDKNALERLMKVLENIKSLLLDTIRIFLCFEMYLKAELLLKGYVVHRFDKGFCKKKFLTFHTDQKEQPISILDMKRAEGLTEEEEPKDGYFHSLIDQTIGNEINKQKYQAVLHHLPELDELLRILEKVKKIRNMVHFCPSQAQFWGNDEKSPYPTLNNYAFLREYVNIHLVKQLDVLCMG